MFVADTASLFFEIRKEQIAYARFLFFLDRRNYRAARDAYKILAEQFALLFWIATCPTHDAFTPSRDHHDACL